MKKQILLLSIYLLINACTVSKVKSQTNENMINYTLSMSNPNTHFFEVEMVIPLISGKFPKHVDVKMAAWTPGSYLIREYAKNVENFSAESESGFVKATKINKNTWRIPTKGTKSIKVKYLVYANELTVRTSYLDDSHGYVNGAPVFMYVPELMNEKSIVNIIPHKSFKKISTALPKIKEGVYSCDNFDMLVDSPIEIGNHEILQFDYKGVKHTIANYSNVKLDYNETKLIADYKSIVEAAHSVVGETHPCKEYLFIIHHLPGLGGGLEHLNSTSCQTSPDIYQNEDSYRGFMGLLAHEYFHLWNVKRIRPEALGPFDYEKENYTNMLWVSEGFTSFYQDDILRRNGMFTESQFLNSCAAKIGTIENAPGNKVQSVAESSWDAWIKFYRPNENANNSTVSYYTKGGVIANVLNLIIIDQSKGKKSLDDALNLLWKDYYLAKGRGFSDAEFREAVEKVAGISLKSFFDNQIYGTETIDYKKYYDAVGLELNFTDSDAKTPWIGISTRNGLVNKVDKNSDAYVSGIYVGDQILNINNMRFSDNSDFVNNKKIGESINIQLLRSGKVMQYDIKLIKNPSQRVSISKKAKLSKEEETKYNKFMHL